MKPLLLTLQAVGPYAGRQTVDFRAVLDSGLFGIYGATGSGKSTIFSAMTFALFGEAARSEQHATTLRSDHAEATLLTQVELIFQNGPRTLRIVRQPEQMRAVKRGSGETKEPHKAWLFDVTGLALDTVSDKNPGKVVAETKVKAVDDAIEKLLGYGAAQFRQIVLLPQGRFEAFLSADTQERLKILRELFDVSLYRRLAETVRTAADRAEKEVAAARAVCEGRLSAENFATMQGLAEGISDADHRHRDLRTAATNAKTTWDAALRAHEAAKQTDTAFQEHVAAERHLAALDEQRPAIDAIQTRLKLARIVHSLVDAASARDKARKDVNDAHARRVKADERLKIIEAESEMAKSACAALARQATEIDKHKTTLHRFRDYAAKLDASEALHQLAAAAHSAALIQAIAVKDAQAKLSALATQKETTAKAVQMSQATELQRLRLNAACTELHQLQTAAEAYDDAAKRETAAREVLQLARSNSEASRLARDRAQADYAAAEAALLQDHAALLATHMKAGEPCPVCGSSEHPAPAHGASSGVILEKVYAEAKANLDSAGKRATQSTTEFEIAKQALADRQAARAALPLPPRSTSDLAAELKNLTAELDRLGHPVDAASLMTLLGNLEADIAAATEALECAREADRDASSAAVAAQQSLADAIAAIPPDLRDAAAVQSAIEKLTTAICDFERDCEAATAAERACAEKRAATDREIETIAEEIDRLTDQRAGFESGFADRLATHGLSPEDYERRKADVTEIPNFEAQIRHFEDQRAAAVDRLHRAAAAIEHLMRPDIAAIAAARDAAAASFEQANDAAIEAATRLSNLQKLLKSLAAEGDRLNKLEKDTAPLRELSEAFAGRTYQKIDLETFAISTLFDHVLEAANLRLSPMTRGRYSLVRETEAKGNARRGLGIAIEDTYTGRQRPTSTLSGGETFIAALALALGLSDVVESAHGSVRLDTIFIDEGFGSLDSDGDSGTLETVLQTLQDIVGTSRSVGLISHVPLVQQAIPNGFFVRKTPGGSHIEIRT